MDSLTTSLWPRGMCHYQAANMPHQIPVPFILFLLSPVVFSKTRNVLFDFQTLLKSCHQQLSFFGLSFLFSRKNNSLCRSLLTRLPGEHNSTFLWFPSCPTENYRGARPSCPSLCPQGPARRRFSLVCTRSAGGGMRK